MDEDRVLESLLELEDKKVIKLLYNFYAKMSDIKEEKMKTALDLMDQLSENSESVEKQLLRKTLLDSYNDLPRKTLELIDDLTKILKE